MLKNLKKVLFALVIALLVSFTFACGEECGPELNKENCSEFCDTCKECGPEANAENCKNFCEECGPEANAENCKDFQNFVAPTDFYMDVNDVVVGETVEVFLDEFEPEGAYEGLVYVSSNPELATVDAEGKVTGVRPGNVTLTAISVLDPEVTCDYEFEVKDSLGTLDVIKREIAYIKSQLPSFVTETYEFPQPWNTNAKATFTVNGEAVEKLVVADLTGDIKNTIGITVSYNDETDSDTTSVVWSVKDAKVNSFTRIQKAVAAADGLMATYNLVGEKVAADLILPATIFGCTMNWASTNPAVIASDGTYVRPLDDKAITLSINATFGENTGKASYNVVAKGYDAAEKMAFILADTFANINGKEFNTDLVLPAYDNTFGAKLTYKSNDTAVYADNGKLVAAPAEAKEVKFTVTVDYAISKGQNFKEEMELVVKAVPATEASKAVNAWLASDAGKKYATVAHAPYGLDAANELDLPVEGYTWNVEGVKLGIKDTEADPYQVFVLTSEGKVKLNAQYLRYTQVNLTGVYTHTDGSKANVSLFLNVGVSPDAMAVYTGTWRSSDQGDGSLTEEQGAYDLISNVSYFDKKIGYIKSSYGSGYWSGYVLQTTSGDKFWEAYIMELMTVYVEKDAEGKVVYNVANANGGNGGNWGLLFVNKTGEEINIEVGTYGTSNYTLKDGGTIASVGSRNNLAIDGNAPAVIVDGEGNVIHKSFDDKFEYNMENKQAYIGGKQYKAGDVIDSVLFAGMADEFKGDDKWEAIYTANAPFAFEAKADGTYKKVTAEDGAVSYVEIKEGEEVTEKFAPKYAKDQVLTAEQFTALTDEEKAFVTATYKAKVAVDFTVPNLLGDSTKGTKVHYLNVPAGGYAMSWKYQFYGVGSPATLRAFTQPAEGQKVYVKHYDVHYLNSMDGTAALNNLVSAEEVLVKADVTKNASAESYVIAARKNYNKLTGATLADVFPAARLEAAETALATLVDQEITAFLASEDTSSQEKQAAFADGLGKLNNRLNKYTEELTAKLTKKADFEAKFTEYGAIDLTITYDYKGGYAQGYIYDSQKSYVMPLFLKDLYDHMVAAGAFQHKVDENGALVEDATLATPSFETFCSSDYWAAFAQYKVTLLTYYLFTPMYSAEGNITAAGDFLNENYRSLVEGAQTFFNTEKGQYWLPLADWVNEATQYANGAGQDFWGRKGLTYVNYDLLAKQSYYNAGTMGKDPSGITSTTSGALLGAFRFAQYVMDSSINANFKTYIPDKAWSTVFDRNTTQTQYGSQIYHCTDLTVKLLDAPYKEGYKFLGWVFEDGTEAVITGALFKDVTVYAKWAAAVEELVEAEIGKDLTPVFYGDKGTSHPYMSATPAGESVEVQAANTGIGTVAVVVGDKLFPLGAKALIELGKDATADTTLTEKAQLQVYGTDGTAQNTTGLAYDATTGAVTVRNSYGYGAMYYNAGEFKLTVTLENCYGRNLDGAKFGYNKYLFSYDSEKKAYVGKMVGASGTCVLQPGDYLWCPMTAERFCSGLTDCNGESGVVGVLSDGVEVQIVRVKVAEDIPFTTVKFVNELDSENPVVLSAQYLEPGQTITKPADLELYGYNFLGWNTSKDATEGIEVPTNVTEDTTYYAIWKQLEQFVATTVNPNTNGTTVAEFATLKEAVEKTLPGGTITVAAGTYAEDLVLSNPVTIIGPNADKTGAATDRADEAVVTGRLDVKGNNVVINGLKFSGGTAADTIPSVALNAVSGFTFINNVVDRLYGTVDTTITGNNRRPFICQIGSVATSNVVIANNKFDFTTHSSTYLKMAAAFNSVENVIFINNTFVGLTNALYMYNFTGIYAFYGNGEGVTSGGKTPTNTSSDGLIVVDANLAEGATTFGEYPAYKTLDEAITAAAEGNTIYLLEGEYSLSIVLSKSLTIKANKAEKVIVNVAKDVENITATTTTFEGMTLKGIGGGGAGTYFQVKGDTPETLTFKKCIFTEMNSAIKNRNGNGCNIIIDKCEINNVGQFFIWVDKPGDITITGSKFDLSSCGAVTSQYAALIRARGAGKLSVINNEIIGDNRNPAFLESGVDAANTAEVMYNTFKGTTKFVYANDNKNIVFNFNLYLDAEGNVLTAVPDGVAGDGITPDATICSSAEDLAAKYAAYLTPAA